MLRFPNLRGYCAQEFISARLESLKFASAALKFAMTVPVRKAGPSCVSAFFIAKSTNLRRSSPFEGNLR
jgi:hypothetical protein